MHPVSKNLVNQGVLELKSVENTNVPISGYLFSLDSGPVVYRYHPVTREPIYHREEKPHWRIDVCASLPEGGASR